MILEIEDQIFVVENITYIGPLRAEPDEFGWTASFYIDDVFMSRYYNISEKIGAKYGNRTENERDASEEFRAELRRCERGARLDMGELRDRVVKAVRDIHG